MDKVCEQCGQNLPLQKQPCSAAHDIEPDQAVIPGIDGQSIPFVSFECPLQKIKKENGFITITADSEDGAKKVSCSMVRRLDDVIDMSKYDIYSDKDTCKIILTGKEEDVPIVILSFKTSVSFDMCLKALEPPFRPHLNSSVQHNRRSPCTAPRRGVGAKTVTPNTLHKLNHGHFQPELVTLREVNISYANQRKDERAEASKRASDEISQSSERSDHFHGQSDEDRSSSGSELDTAVGELRVEDVDPSILQEGCYAKERRNKKTVKLTSDQFDALQVKKLLNSHKLIITRGGVFNQVTLLEGDEVMKVNGQKSQSLNQNNSPSAESVTVTVRSCPNAICASNIPNNTKGLGITWNNTVVENVSDGPLAQDSVFDPLRVSKGNFSLTHVNGNFIPFCTNREKIYHLLQKAGKCVDLVFQPTQRMKAVAGLEYKGDS